MTIKCREIIHVLENYAPPRFALADDPIGLQLGHPNQIIERLFVALEMDDEVLREALDFGAQMIVVHHTPFFKPFKQMREDSFHNRVVLDMIRHRMALYTAHTNLDCVRGGVNDVLAERLGIKETEILEPLNENTTSAGLGRIGMLPEPMTVKALADCTAEALGNGNVRFCGDPKTMIQRVAVCGGTGAFLMLHAVQKGAQAFVTADVKHHEALQALDMGLCMIDGGHYATERPAMSILARHLATHLEGVEIREAQRCTDPFRS